MVPDIMENDCGTLSYYGKSFKGTITDYAISFKDSEMDFGSVTGRTSDLFLQLMDKYKDCIVKARLVAKVNFTHLINEDERSYHFSSHQAEVVIDPLDFFERHMLRITSRMEEFNAHGSNVVMKNISHIHIQLSCIGVPETTV